MQPLTLGDQLTQVRLKTRDNFAELATDFSGLPVIGSGMGFIKFREVCNLYLTAAGAPTLKHSDQLPETKKVLNRFFGFVEYSGAELFQNPSFDEGDSGWTYDANWSFSGGLAISDGTQGADAFSLYQTTPLYSGLVYEFTYEIKSTDGIGDGVRAQVGGQVAGSWNNTVGIYTQSVVAAGTNTVGLETDAAFLGSIGFMSLRLLSGQTP